MPSDILNKDLREKIEKQMEMQEPDNSPSMLIDFLSKNRVHIQRLSHNKFRRACFQCDPLARLYQTTDVLIVIKDSK